MAEGTVRWFNSEKGYGFIVPDGGAGEVYVHYSEIQVNGYKSLDPGDRVSFDVTYGADGVRAVTVTPLGEWRPPPAAPSSGPVELGGAAEPAGPADGGGGGPARGGAGRGVVLGLLALLMLAAGVAFVVVGMIQGEEIGAVFLLLALAIGGLVAWIERD